MDFADWIAEIQQTVTFVIEPDDWRKYAASDRRGRLIGAMGTLALGVWSRDEVTRVKFEDVGRCRPGMADGFEGVLHRSALRCLARL